MIRDLPVSVMSLVVSPFVIAVALLMTLGVASWTDGVELSEALSLAALIAGWTSAWSP
jgi:membrane protein CcdC involved in cytochrome C biogenesis